MPSLRRCRYDDYGEAFEPGDVIGCLLDRDNQTVSFAKNGVDLGVAFQIGPDMQRTGLKPALCGKGFHAQCNFDFAEFPIDGSPEQPTALWRGTGHVMRMRRHSRGSLRCSVPKRRYDCVGLIEPSHTPPPSRAAEPSPGPAEPKRRAAAPRHWAAEPGPRGC